MTTETSILGSYVSLFKCLPINQTTDYRTHQQSYNITDFRSYMSMSELTTSSTRPVTVHHSKTRLPCRLPRLTFHLITAGLQIMAHMSDQKGGLTQFYIWLRTDGPNPRKPKAWGARLIFASCNFTAQFPLILHAAETFPWTRTTH